MTSTGQDARSARHVVSRLVVASSIPLPEVSSARPGSAVDVEFTCVDGAPPSSNDWRWYRQWTLPGGQPWLAFARRDREFLLAFDGVHFTFAPEAMAVRAYRNPATPLVTVRHLLLDQVMPLVLSQRGDLALHAGCVSTGAGAIAFLGRSGAGKSTLVASFAAAGARIVTDDALLLEERENAWWAVRSYPGVRLWPRTAHVVMRARRGRDARVSHYNRKVRIVPDDDVEAIDPARVRRLYVLDPRARDANAPVRIERLSGRAAFLPLVALTYRLDFDDAEALQRDFARMASLVERDLVRKLVVPSGFSQLARVRRAIENDLASS